MWGTGAPSYRLVVEDRPGYLYASISAEGDSFELEMQAVTELAAICRSRDAGKLLVEHSIPSRLSTLEVYTIAVQLPKLYQGIVVAFVIHRPQSADDAEFLEVVARNRGAKGRLFSSAREAENWLLSLG
jgi:hypothetical protein